MYGLYENNINPKKPVYHWQLVESKEEAVELATNPAVGTLVAVCEKVEDAQDWGTPTEETHTTGVRKSRISEEEFEKLVEQYIVALLIGDEVSQPAASVNRKKEGWQEVALIKAMIYNEGLVYPKAYDAVIREANAEYKERQKEESKTIAEYETGGGFKSAVKIYKITLEMRHLKYANPNLFAGQKQELINQIVAIRGAIYTECKKQGWEYADVIKQAKAEYAAKGKS